MPSEKHFVLEPFWYGVPLALGTNHSNIAGVANRVALCPVEIRRPAIISHACIRVVTAGGVGTNLRIGIYADTGNKPDGGKLLAESANIDAASTGAKLFTLTNPIKIPAGLLWAAIETADATVQYRGYENNEIFSEIGSEKLTGCSYALGGFGNLTDPCPATTIAAAIKPVSVVRVSSFLE